MGAASLLARIYTELLWYAELGDEDVFWTTLKWKVLAYGIVGIGTAGFLLVNFAIVERVMAGRDEPADRPAHVALPAAQRRLVYPVVAIAAGVLCSKWQHHGTWQQLALWTGRNEFGVADPLFHRDVGFFVFSLPLYQQAAGWLLEMLAIAGATTLAAYAAAGGVRLGQRLVVVRGARAHLLVLGALALVVVAWRYRLDALALALPREGAKLPGAGYTDVHVRMPALRILAWLSLGGAALLLYAARRRVLLRPAVAVLALALVATASPDFLAGPVERYAVEPEKLSRERPYVADAIAATRRAFALDRVAVRAPPQSGSLSARDLATDRVTLDNVPLWDDDVLRPALDDLQALGRYYRFPSTTVDRYTIDGAPEVLTLAARQLDLRGLGPDAEGWANPRLAYTHGYGVVAVASTRTDKGQPRFAQSGFRSGANPLGLREPRVYFGEQPDDRPPYVVVASRRAEVDEPAPGSQRPDYHYDGPGGIRLSSFLRRAAFAARFGDLNLLLSETVTARSRILMRRNVGERLRALAPFLRWDAHPQTTVVNGRVAFVFNGITTSDHYPYSMPVQMGRARVNYVRAAAHAVVDGFSGRVSIYAAESGDPILSAWRTVYPDLFLPATRMPSEVRARLHYPKALFAAQVEAYATYHAGEPTAFWNGSDAWHRPLQLSGPIERAGEIRFPDPERSVDADERRENGVGAASEWRARPTYVFARLPGDERERFMLVMPYTPRGRENLVGYLAAWLDGRGRPQLAVLSLPRDRLTLGPSQATRRILANAGVSQRLELSNKESRDLGKSSVDRTILGAPRLVPVGGALVQVQPVYLVAAGGGVPRLRLVTVQANGRVGYGRDVEAALRRTIPGPARASGGP